MTDADTAGHAGIVFIRTDEMTDLRKAPKTGLPATGAPVDPARHRWVWGALLLSLTVVATGQSYLLLMLPPLGRTAGLDDIAVAALIGGGALLAVIAAPCWGKLSERIGRRRVLLAAQILAAAGWILFGLLIWLLRQGRIGTDTFFMLLLLTRIVQATGSSGILPAALALIADMTGPARRTGGFGRIGAAYGVGGILGGIIMWRFGIPYAATVFVGLGLAALCAQVAGLRTLPDARRVTSQPRQSWAQIELPPGAIALLLSTLFTITAYGVMKQVITLYLSDAVGMPMDLAVSRAGQAMTGSAVVTILVQSLLIPLLRCRPEILQALGASCGTFALVLCSLSAGFGMLLAGALLFGLAIGLMIPGNLGTFSLRANPGTQGMIAGLNVMAQSAGLVLGPLAGAVLHGLSPALPFPIATLLMLAPLMLAIRIWHTRPAADFPAWRQDKAA